MCCVSLLGAARTAPPIPPGTTPHTTVARREGFQISTSDRTQRANRRPDTPQAQARDHTTVGPLRIVPNWLTGGGKRRIISVTNPHLQSLIINKSRSDQVCGPKRSGRVRRAVRRLSAWFVRSTALQAGGPRLAAHGPNLDNAPGWAPRRSSIAAPRAGAAACGPILHQARQREA